MSPDVVLVTYSGLPDLDPDDRPLAAALAARGLEVAIVAWDDAVFDWTSARLVLLRNPWDYYRRVDEFLSWTERVARQTVLLNPLPVVRWNLHKGYLVELAARGAPVVPTALLRQGEIVELARLLNERNWTDFILKPAVSADSWETHRSSRADSERAQAQVERLLGERDLLVQPYLPAVEEYGERCLVFLDGAYSHAVKKNALTRGGRWTDLPEGVPVEATAAERAAAERILAAAGFDDLLYARVDLVRDARGEPLLLELELVEPTLFLAGSPTGLARLCAAVEERAARRVP